MSEMIARRMKVLQHLGIEGTGDSHVDDIDTARCSAFINTLTA
jgi:hypothetical protein